MKVNTNKWLVRITHNVLNFEVGARTICQPLKRIDFAILIAVILLACGGYIAAVLLWGDGAMRLSLSGRWFQSDGWRVFDDMTELGANHFRDGVHPIFSLVSLSGTALIRAVASVGPLTAIRIVNGMAFMLWSGMLFATMRLIGVKIIDALLLLLLAAVSAGSLFWFLVPETYVPGTVSILVCFFVVALATKRDWLFVLAAAASLSFTVTNWIAGLSAIASSRSVGRGIIIATLSVGIVVAGWAVGKAIYPQPSRLFLLPSVVQGESDYINNRDAGGISAKLAGALVSPIVAPELQRTSEQPTGALLSFQATAVKTWVSGNILFILSAATWLLVLGLSLPALLLRRDRFSVALGLTLGGQLALHLVYGDETFLYSLHFVPLLVLLLAIATTTPMRRIVLPLTFLLTILVGANNVIRLDQAVHEPFKGDDPRLGRLRANP
jgi:hypothetical protein